MIEIFVASFYIVLFAFLIVRFDFSSLREIGKMPLLVLFGLKIIAGFLYVFISQNVISAGDVFSYYKDGLIVYGRLTEGDFLSYLQLTFGLNNVNISSNISESVHQMGYWYDSSAYMMVRINALINIFSFGKGVYVNAVFFSFLSFMACLLLAKVFEQNLKAKSAIVYYTIFLAPSVFFWTSGMHKETLSVLLIALILYSFFKFFVSHKIKNLVVFVLSFALLYQTRFFIASMLLPPILAFLIWNFMKLGRPLLVFTIFFSLLLATTYILPAIFGIPNLVDEVLEKKALYEALDNGNTAIDLGVYEASYFGILKKVPQALFNSIVRPHFMDVKSWFLAMASLESFLISCSFLGSLFYFKHFRQRERAIIYVFFSFALSYLILTGLIVPNIGAILRYRSVALFLLYPSVVFLLERRNLI